MMPESTVSKSEARLRELDEAYDLIDALQAKLARVENVQRYSMMKSESEDGTLTIKFVEDAAGIFVDYKHLKQELEKD